MAKYIIDSLTHDYDDVSGQSRFNEKQSWDFISCNSNTPVGNEFQFVGRGVGGSILFQPGHSAVVSPKREQTTNNYSAQIILVLVA